MMLVCQRVEIADVMIAMNIWGGCSFKAIELGKSGMVHGFDHDVGLSEEKQSEVNMFIQNKGNKTICFTPTQTYSNDPGTFGT